MNQFKFGDMIFHNEHGTGLVVNGNINNDSASVIFEGDSRPYWFDKADLKLIPHPDTVRLNWLEDQMGEGDLGQIVFDGYFFKSAASMQYESEEGFENIRDAIDFAFSEENANE